MYLQPGSVCCTGTSGLSITELAEELTEVQRTAFFGMHMFNPPYVMVLCEMIKTKYSDYTLFAEIKEYARNILRRNVVDIKDSPGFLGNRIGFQFINRAIQYAEMYKDAGGIDYIDNILGTFTGRNMPPIMTSDFVGIDVHKAIVDYLFENTHDFANHTFKLPEFADELILNGKLGKKVNEGFYKTITGASGHKIRYVYDIQSAKYRPENTFNFSFINKMKKLIKESNYRLAYDSLINSDEFEARICVEFLITYVLYSMVATEEVGDHPGAADDVMATGFNWCPPYGIIEALGGEKVFEELVKERIDRRIQKSIQVNMLFEKIEYSKYDYRRYIKA